MMVNSKKDYVCTVPGIHFGNSARKADPTLHGKFQSMKMVSRYQQYLQYEYRYEDSGRAVDVQYLPAVPVNHRTHTFTLGSCSCRQ
jgi:hypothetical protein